MRPTRRTFIKSAVVAGFPTIIPSGLLGQGDKPAPSNRITMACIGVGGMGSGNLNAFLQDGRVQVVGICDVDSNHKNRGLAAAKLKEGDGYSDFREVVARDDIDAVMIATPDHWHSLITVAAAKSGKDIYCEKPLAASIGEGRFVCDALKKHERVLQCGTWRRSGVYVRWACELVRNGYIGDLKEIICGVPGKFAIRGGFTGLEEPQEVPAELDYEMWQGPAKAAPYSAARCHFNFRWVDQYAPGYITDWGAHFLDVAQWGNGTDDTAPVSVEATGVTKREKGIYDAPESFSVIYEYANGVRMKMMSTEDKELWGTKFVGSKGWIFTENTKFVTEPKGLRSTKTKDGERKLYVSENHHRNFIDSVKSRQRTAATAEASHRAATCCHLGAIAAEVGGRLAFDPATEKFENEAANALLMRPMRGEWKLG